MDAVASVRAAESASDSSRIRVAFSWFTVGFSMFTATGAMIVIDDYRSSRRRRRMSTGAMVNYSASRADAVAERAGLDNGSWRRSAVRRGTVQPWQRLAAAIWDGQFLCVQRAVYGAAPRLAAHLDELARRRDERRREHP
ncbi:hypothetical protein [Pseudonocardia sp. DLS-67]